MAACRVRLHDHSREDLAIEMLADAERLRQLELAILED
jgi:hypothetical protein